MSLATVIERSRKEKESWRYTDLEALMGKNFADVKGSPVPNRDVPLPSVVGDTSQRRQIVFVNGAWSAELSHLGELPQGVLAGGANNEYRLTLEGATCLITAPIELVFMSEPNGEPQESTTKLNIEVGRSGRLTLIEHHLGMSQQAVAKIIDTEISLGAQSKLMHGKVLHGESAAVHLATTKVHVAEGAYYGNFALIKGRKLVRNEIEVMLEGQLAQCVLNGAMLLRGREHADTTTRIVHAAPHGSSRQVYKTVLGGQSRGVFQGKIVVAEGAQKTDGYQMSRALLLSDQAEMDAKPELEIYADDVKCSHGSTVGDLDPEALFYLRTRGLNETEARALLVRAFVDEILEQVQVPEWRALCRTGLEGWLDEQG